MIREPRYQTIVVLTIFDIMYTMNTTHVLFIYSLNLLKKNFLRETLVVSKSSWTHRKFSLKIEQNKANEKTHRTFQIKLKRFS